MTAYAQIQTALRIVVLFQAFQTFSIVAAVLLLVGSVYGLTMALTYRLGLPALASVLVLSGIIIFFMGLLTDQVVALRMERLEEDVSAEARPSHRLAMCGIAGIFHYGSRGSSARRGTTVDREVLERMTDALAHRGPDGRGVLVEGAVGFGHRRLAILDPSPRGAQPLTSASRQTTITFNGEIYRLFASCGIDWRGSDTGSIRRRIPR